MERVTGGRRCASDGKVKERKGLCGGMFKLRLEGREGDGHG